MRRVDGNSVTYDIARQVGYTPEHACRIASANVSVDYSCPNEPVQAGIQSIVGMPGTQKDLLEEFSTLRQVREQERRGFNEILSKIRPQ